MGTIASCVSNLMYISERIALYLTCVGLISCLILTFVSTLGMGIGLGYNYCFVDLKTRHKYVPGHYIYKGQSPRWPGRTREQPYDPKDVSLAEEELSKRITIADFTDEIGVFERPAPTTPEDDNDIEADLPTTTEDDNDIDQTMSYLNNSSIDFKDNTTKESNEESLKSLEKISSRESDIDDDQDELDSESHSDIPSSNNSDSSSRKVKKLVIPLSGLDLISVLSKLKDERKNYSLQIITT